MNIMVLKIGSIRLSISHDSDPIRLIRSKSDQTKVPTNKPTIRPANQTNHLVQFFYFLFSRHLRGCSHYCRPLERRHVGSTRRQHLLTLETVPQMNWKPPPTSTSPPKKVLETNPPSSATPSSHQQHTHPLPPATRPKA